MRKLLSVVFALFVGSVMMAQTTISGTVTEAKSGQPIPGANIKVVGKSIGTTADFDGNFSFKINEDLPFTIEVSLIGYSSTEVEITENNQIANVALKETATVLDEIVLSASRTPERVLESPVTIERMDIRAIRNTSSPTFYDGLENLKGVDVNTNSLTFKSVNTRGFATFSNTRFMQLVDGMDNSSPALNFNLGNLLGMSELDINTVELMPGASSALYGANAFNGILFMTSKNPFDSAGISVYGKTGLTSSESAGDNNFIDAGIRIAHKFSDKFAAKASFSFLKGTEWHATDYRDYDYVNSTAGSPTRIVPETGQASFDRANIYGDEVTLAKSPFGDLQGVAGFLASTTNPELAPLVAFIPKDNVSRTGYKERDLTDYEARSSKINVALHYRPFGDDLEIIYNGKVGRGNTIYQGSNRYSIKDFFMQQHKLEIKNDNFFVRAYMTDEDAGDSYDMRFAGINMNKVDAATWFGTYAGAYATGASQILQGGGSPADITAASPQLHAGARQFADANVTLQPGTAAFDAALATVTSDPNIITGAKFQDESKIYHADANYNFHELIDFADIQVGGSWRQFSLNSNGTIFTDYDGPIDYNEYGAYTQIQKKFIDDRLKFTGSIRYDKAKNFDGNVSPRISISYSLGQDKTRNLRASFQTGFRNPTTQDQYIGLDSGAGILVGSAPDNLDRYNSNPLSVSATGQMIVNNLTGGTIGSTLILTGRDPYENAFSASSIANETYQKANFEYVKPEKVSAYEIGYRAGFGNLALDMSAYYNKYEDFIGNKNVAVPFYGNPNLSDIVDLTPIGGVPTPLALVALSQGDYMGFQVYTNSEADISSYGGSIGVSTKVAENYSLGLSYTYSKFDFDQASDPDYEAGFNTPENKVKFSIGNTDLIENLGFNFNLRWNDEYFWQSTFIDAMIESKTVVDAQINYTIPKWKSTFKIGGANLGGQEYLSAPGNGKIGSQYFASWTINP